LAIALKELSSWLSEIDADALDPPELPELPEPPPLELLELLHPAMSSAAALAAAAAASPALAETEYTDVPRLSSADMPGHVRDQIHADPAGFQPDFGNRRTVSRNVAVNVFVST